MRVLVTGATGHVGRHLVPALLARDMHVRVATRRPTAATWPGVEAVAVGDLCEEINWRPILSGIDTVVHLAVHRHQSGARSDFDRVNCWATVRLAGAARTAGCRFVFVSSVAAQCGASWTGILSETDEPHPETEHGRSKLKAERQVAEVGGEFAILRSPRVYGSTARGNLRRLITAARTPLPLPFGAIHNRRSWVFVENLVAAIVHVIALENAPNAVLHVADPDPVSLSAAIKALRAEWGRRPGLIAVPPRLLETAFVAMGKGEAWRQMAGDLELSTARLRSLGFVPPVGTAEGLARLARAAGPVGRAG